MHIHVLGSGAIGYLVSHYLRASLDPKHTISVIHRTAVSALAASRLPGVKLEVTGVTRLQPGILHDAREFGADVGLRESLAIRRARRLARRPRVKSLKKNIEKTIEAESPRAQHTEHGIQAQSSRAKHPPTTPWYDAQHKAGPIESLIIATKANEAASGIRTLLPRLSANSTIVLLHNGLCVYEHITEHIFRNKAHRPHIVLSANSHGAFLKDIGHVVHTGIGSIQLGIAPDPLGRDFEQSIDDSLPKEERRTNLNDITPLLNDPLATRYLSLRNTISALTSTTALDVTWSPLFDVRIAMQRKLAVDCIINPVTALLGCRNGDILQHPTGRHLALAVCQEVSNVFHAQWRTEVWKLLPMDPRATTPKPQRDLDEDPYQGERTEGGMEEHMFEAPFPAGLTSQQLFEECTRVAELTRENVSSMLADIRHGHKTEINYLDGYILTLAKRYRVYTPVTAALVDLIGLRQKIPIDKPVPLQSVL